MPFRPLAPVCLGLFVVFTTGISAQQQRASPQQPAGVKQPSPLIKRPEPPPALREAEYTSTNGAYVLHLTPDAEWPKRLGGCQAVLSKANPHELVWTRHLVNDCGPVQVKITDSGQHVVTFDEWNEIGNLPIVVYGPGGRLIRVHSLTSLGLDEDRQRMKRSDASVLWNQGALLFFSPNEQQLCIRLRWGRLLILDLRTGDLMDDAWVARHVPWQLQKNDWDALRSFADRYIRETALQWFHSKNADERETAIAIARQLQLREAIPLLRELLQDQTSFLTRRSDGPWTTVYYIRDAARAALEDLEDKAETPTTSKAP